MTEKRQCKHRKITHQEGESYNRLLERVCQRNRDKDEWVRLFSQFGGDNSICLLVSIYLLGVGITKEHLRNIRFHSRSRVPFVYSPWVIPIQLSLESVPRYDSFFTIADLMEEVSTPISYNGVLSYKDVVAKIDPNQPEDSIGDTGMYNKGAYTRLMYTAKNANKKLLLSFLKFITAIAKQSGQRRLCKEDQDGRSNCRFAMDLGDKYPTQSNIIILPNNWVVIPFIPVIYLKLILKYPALMNLFMDPLSNLYPSNLIYADSKTLVVPKVY